MANKNDLVKPSESSQAQVVEGNQWKSRETKRDQVKQDRTNRVRGTPSEYVDHLSTHVSLSPPLSGSCLGGHDIHCRSSPMMTRALWLAFGEAYIKTLGCDSKCPVLASVAYMRHAGGSLRKHLCHWI